jgi:methylmalonyl-CoA mutase cobalamin-binding subunit
MRVVFIGAVDFSRAALERLLATAAEVVGVCTLESSAVNSDHCDLASMCGKAGVAWQCAAFGGRVFVKTLVGKLILDGVSS